MSVYLKTVKSWIMEQQRPPVYKEEDWAPGQSGQARNWTGFLQTFNITRVPIIIRYSVILEIKKKCYFNFKLRN